MAHRDDREAIRARADAAARDLADAQLELERLAPEKHRLELENEALRSKLVRFAPPEEVPAHPLWKKPARTNLVSMSIALGVLTTLLFVGLALAALITSGLAAPISSQLVPAAPGRSAPGGGLALAHERSARATNQIRALRTRADRRSGRERPAHVGRI